MVHLSKKGEKNLNLSYNNFYLKFSQTILNICEISFDEINLKTIWP